MSDQQQRTQWALDLFREFIRNWTPMATHAQLNEVRTPNDGQAIRAAIKAIAPQADHSRRVGWAVFKREHDRDYDRERPSGYVHTMISAVFENPAQAANAQQACYSKHPEDTFIICVVQEIS